VRIAACEGVWSWLPDRLQVFATAVAGASNERARVDGSRSLGLESTLVTTADLSGEPTRKRRLGKCIAETGSSDFGVGQLPGGQDHSESVVVGVAEAAGDAAVELDDAVHGFGAAVVGSAGGEVGQELVLPGPEGAAEPRDLGDRAGRAYICSVERNT
jgi:hypothetical protein